MNPAARYIRHRFFFGVVLGIFAAILFSQWGNRVYAVSLTGYLYQRTITLTNAGGPLTDYDVLVQLDTASLISAGKMQATCDDTRFIDSDGVTPLSFWLEQGCNSNATQYWVRMPSVPTGSRDITLFYGNPDDPSESQGWDGNFIIMNNTACPAGWTRVSALDGKLPRGNSTYGGTGGAATHTHTSSSSFTWTTNTHTSVSGGAGEPAAQEHTHNYAFTTNSSSNLPAYREVIFCSKSAPIEKFDTSYVLMYDSVPANWTNYTDLNGKFAYGSSTYGATGGSDTHTNTVNNGTTTNFANGYRRIYGGGNCCFSFGHEHTFTVTLTSASSLPPYTEYIPAAVSSGTQPFGDGAITFFDSAPPYGWTRLSALDTKFIRLNSTSGSTGGVASHNHPYTASGLGPGGGSTLNYSGGGGDQVAYDTHTHSTSTNTSTNSNLPPYVDFLIYQRKTDSLGQSIGAESGGPVATPTPIQVPGLLDISGTTATFSATLFGQKFYDVADPAYFLDPAGSQSLVTAGKTSIATLNTSQTLNIAGNIAFTHGMIKDNAGKLQFQAGGSRTGNNSSSSIYFLDASGNTRGRFDTRTTAGAPAYGTFFLGATDTSASDVAEHYPSVQPLGSGEIVALDTDHPLHIIQATHAYDRNILGIISTNPGFVLGQGDAPQKVPTYPVALAGRVPVRMDPTSPPLRIGDYLTASETNAGKATKATRAGYVVAKALEDWSCTASSCPTMIQVFVKLSYYMGEIGTEGTLNVTNTITGNDDIRGSLVLSENATSITVSRNWEHAPISVNATPTWDTSLFITDITNQGFTIHVSHAPNASGQIYWKAWW